MADQYPYPVARVGIIGGGQLGRMLVMAAHRLGCTATVLDPARNSPAGQVAGHQIDGNYDDRARLRELVEACDVTTFDIEDIDSDALIKLAAEGHRIFPPPALLARVQDKLLQKQAFFDAGLASSEFIATDNPDPDAFQAFGYPLVQKARRGGYDGRGVVVMQGPQDFAEHLPVPSLIERFVEAEKELAVMVARGQDGEICSYPVVEMLFRSGQNMLDRLLAPARVDQDLAERARGLAERTVEALGGVGIFGIELFLTKQGELLVNEVAPRTHNSGHYTIEACLTDQFEQHLRAIIGLPLGSADLLRPAVMLNLVGEPGSQGRPRIEGLNAALSVPGVSVHLYGKAESRPYRKMGHVTILGEDLEQACRRADAVAGTIRISGEDPV